MAGVGADFWVCGDCRSVNNLRAKQCYNCRTPKDVAEVDPAQIEGTGRGRLREIALPPFKASRLEAALASALIILVGVAQVVSTVLDARLLGRVSDDPDLLTDPAFMQSFDVLLAGTVAVIVIGIALLALTAWAWWLSRVVSAMPALGLGYPPTTGMMAFVENFLPGLNLFRVPAIVRDVMRRLEPGHTRGEALIFAAWIGLLGGVLVPRFGGFLAVLETGTIQEAVRRTLLIQVVSTGLVLVGAVFLVVLIWWIEQRVALRRVAQLEGEPAAAAGSPSMSVSPSEAPAAAAETPLPSLDLSPAGPATPPPGFVAAAVAIGGDGASSPPAVPETPPIPDPLAATVLNRPITAVTGTASIPAGSLTRPPEQPPTMDPPPVAEPTPTEPAEAPGHAAAAADDPATLPSPHTPTGPVLYLRVQDATTMIGTVEAESEAITLDGLRQAAPALAQAGGSARIATVTDTFEARKLAHEAFQILSDARVQTTIEE